MVKENAFFSVTEALIADKTLNREGKSVAV